MSKNQKQILSYLFSGVMFVFCVLPFLVQAQGGSSVNPGGSSDQPSAPSVGTIVIKNPFKGGNSIEGFIRLIVNDILMPIGGVVAVLMIMYAGFQYVTAGGDPGKIKTAHQALLWAVIGAVILLGAWVISQSISGTIDALKK